MPKSVCLIVVVAWYRPEPAGCTRSSIGADCPASSNVPRTVPDASVDGSTGQLCPGLAGTPSR